MRTRILLLAAILSPVLSLQAIVDTNENGLSDLWEKQHNNDELFPETFDPEADPDADGWTNAQEAAAGTDPFSTVHPDGHLQPETTHIPATWGDIDNDNIPDLLTPEVIQVSWPTIPGKQYTLQSNPDLTPDNWIDVDTPFIGTGTVVTYNFVTSAATKTFWRVNITDFDSDSDNLSDAEENQIGSNPQLLDSDGDGLNDGEEIANLTDPTNSDTDNDGTEDANDAAPTESLIDWEPTPESSYILIDVETSSQFAYPRDLNDKGEVLFEDGIWSGGNWIPKILPAGNGNAPSNVTYEINYGPWTHFNASGTLLGRSHLRFLEGPSSGGDGVGAPVFLPSNQSSPSLILDTGDVWDPFPFFYRPHGVAADGSMAIRMDSLTIGTSQIIKRFNAAGNFVGDITSTGGYEPTGSEGHGEMTASGWVASNLVRTATDTAPAVYRVGLWNTANEEKVLPTNAEGWAYPVGVADLPNEKVVLLAGKWINDTYSGRVFLPDSAGAYQAVESLSNKKILRFAGDGTAITQDHKLWRNGKLIPLRELCQRYGELLDAEWNLHPLKANKHGSYLVQAEGPDGQIKTKILHKMGILSDTNRDGFVNQKGDEKGKSEWNTARGTIFSVNFDRDRQTQPAGSGAPTCDAITWWGQSGQPEEEDWQINSAEDVEDITPFEISTGALPSGTKVYLTAEESEDVRAIHVFPRLSGNEMAIWGGFKTEGRPWADGDSNPLDIEITSWLRPRTGEVGYNETESGIVAGTYRFGLEGLVFRGMTVPGGTLSSGKFSGLIDLGVEVAIAGSQTRYKAGTIRMKVSPFLLTHNDRPTDKVFVRDMPNGLQSMPKSAPISSGLPNNNGSQWLQDHVEIGYTQRPGGPLIKMTFVCPYETNQLATWPRTHLLASGKGIFALGNNLGGGGGDYGGNIELSNPQASYPHGRILAGSKISPLLRTFFSISGDSNASRT